MTAGSRRSQVGDRLVAAKEKITLNDVTSSLIPNAEIVAFPPRHWSGDPAC